MDNTAVMGGFRACDVTKNETPNISDPHSCVDPFYLPHPTGFAIPLYGIVSPILILTTIITNFIVCIVLLTKHMRTPTNVLLVAIAVADTLTGVCPLPCFLYFFSAGFYTEFLSYNWCITYVYLIDFLPTIFHTSTIWLTVALAVHRYITLSRPMVAQGSGGSSGAKRSGCMDMVRVACVIFLAAFAFHFIRFFENRFEPVAVEDASGAVTYGCLKGLRPFVEMNQSLYFNIYYWFRVTFIHVVPCSTLVVLNVFLVSTMRTAFNRRKQLLKQRRRTESRRLAESNVTTLMLVIVVGIFLIVELPSALFFTLFIIESSFSLVLLDKSVRHTASMFINLAILFSYPVNFFIYCAMSDKFRTTFAQVFLRASFQSGGVMNTEVTTGLYRNSVHNAMPMGANGENKKNESAEKNDETFV